jgi:hypothetical protein
MANHRLPQCVTKNVDDPALQQDPDCLVTYNFVFRKEGTDTDPVVLTLTRAKIAQYPESKFWLLVKEQTDESHDIKMSVFFPQTVVTAIKKFYDTGYWPNPYMNKNRSAFEIPTISRSLEELVEYLNIPSNDFDDGRDEEEEEDNNDNYRDPEDAFYIDYIDYNGYNESDPEMNDPSADDLDYGYPCIVSGELDPA